MFGKYGGACDDVRHTDGHLLGAYCRGRKTYEYLNLQLNTEA